jgi:hypothetical protein
MNRGFAELQQLVNAPDPSTGTILSAAVDTLRRYEEEVKGLELMRAQASLNLEESKVSAIVRANLSHGVAVEEGADAPLRVIPGHDVHDSASAFRSNPRLALTSAFLHSSMPLLVTMLDGKIVASNRSLRDVLKNNDEDLLHSLTVFTISHPSFRPKAYTMMHNVVSGASAVEHTNGPERIVDCKGNLLSVHVTAWNVRDKEGRIKYVMAALVPLEVVPKIDPLSRVEERH